MDEVLELLRGMPPEFANEYTNHGPMAAEALCFLGREEAALKWTHNYKRVHFEAYRQTNQKIPVNER